MASFKPVTAALRAFEVLTIVNRLPSPSFAKIHRESQLSSATVVRVLETLEAAGLVLKDQASGHYFPTSRTLSLSAGYNLARQLGLVCKPMLYDLQNRINWPSDVAVRDRDSMVLVQTSREQGRLFFDRGPGYRAPVLGTSLGMAYLAYASESVVEEVISTTVAERAPWNLVAKSPAKFRKTLAAIRQKGFAQMDPNYSRLIYDSKISSIGVPIIANGQLLGAINVMFFTDVVDDRAANEKLVPELLKAAHSIGVNFSDPTKLDASKSTGL